MLKATSRLSKLFLAAGVLALLVSPAPAGVPTDPAKRAAVVGQPASLVVEPSALTLSGPRSMQQMIVTGRYADGTQRDLTALASYSIDTPVLALDQTGFVVAGQNGTA